MRRRSIDRMGNGRGQKPMMHKISVLDEDNYATEKENVRKAITGATSRVRVVATQGVVRPDAIREIADKSPHADSKELAKTKLKGLGHKI